MVEIDIESKQLELLEESQFTEIMNNINMFIDKQRGFILSDVIDNSNNPYYRYMAKGILSALVGLGYIRIFSLYNGNRNFVYMGVKRIQNDN